MATIAINLYISKNFSSFLYVFKMIVRMRLLCIFIDKMVTPNSKYMVLPFDAFFQSFISENLTLIDFCVDKKLKGIDNLLNTKSIDLYNIWWFVHLIQGVLYERIHVRMVTLYHYHVRPLFCFADVWIFPSSGCLGWLQLRVEHNNTIFIRRPIIHIIITMQW